MKKEEPAVVVDHQSVVLNNASIIPQSRIHHINYLLTFSTKRLNFRTIICQVLYSSFKRIHNTPKDINIGKWVSNPDVDDKSTFYCLKSMIKHIGNNENEGK